MTLPTHPTPTRRSESKDRPPFGYSYLVLTILLLLTVGATIAYHQDVGMFRHNSVGWTPVVFVIGVCISFLIFGLTHRDSVVRRELEARTRELTAIQKQNEVLLEAEQKSRRAAEEANRGKDEFLAVVSHELRTPLHAITGWSRVLKTDGLSDEERARAISKIDKNLRIQAAMIDELLNFSEIMSGGLAVITKPIVVREVFDEALEAADAEARRKGVTLVTKNSLEFERVLGDKARLRLAIAHVVANAVKFTPAGGSVETDTYVSDDWVKCVVSDTGSGIPPEFLPHIFEQYTQSENHATRQFSGLGLGLTLAERIVQLHHGKIEAASSGVGKGATFTISLPVRQ
jgi:signal transduction histidine kinase